MVEYVENGVYLDGRRINTLGKKIKKDMKTISKIPSKDDVFRMINLYLSNHLFKVLAWFITGFFGIVAAFVLPFYSSYVEFKSNTTIGLEKVNEGIAAIKTSLNDLGIQVPEIYIYISPEAGLFHKMSNALSLTESVYAAEPDFTEDEFVATNEDGRQLKFSEIKGVPFCYKYYEGDVEHWFYGTLNESGQWNGETILIEYIGDELVGLKEALYKDGILGGTYKQFNREGSDYRFTKRIRSGEHSFDTGETFVYSNVVLPKERFKSKIPIRYDECESGKLKQYYRGNVSDKKYNDVSGEAFLVNFNNDETVRVFYSGNIENGEFKDADGNAFWICLTNDGSQYTYYKGSFANNNPIDSNWLEQPYSRIGHNEDPSGFLPPKYNSLDLKWKTW